MKYINEEAKPFGQCSKEVQDQLTDAIGTGRLKILMPYGWVKRSGCDKLEIHYTYRAKIKVSPSHLAGMWCTWGDGTIKYLVSGFTNYAIRIDKYWKGLDSRDFIFSKDATLPVEEWKTISEIEDELNEENK